MTTRKGTNKNTFRIKNKTMKQEVTDIANNNKYGMCSLSSAL